ncbi:MAG TPA: flagellar motor switch protein FliN [Burkholderiales bacterium]|nr:flagellar motor switch protein FliN [Burkholderiales bacterium]
MSEQTTQEPAADDWAAAMAEQTTTEAAAASAAPAAESTPVGTEAPEAAAEPAAAAAAEPSAAAAERAPTAVFEQFSAPAAPGAANDIDLILDIPVQLTVELGRTKIAIKNLLQLAQGSVVELDGLAGEPMDVFVNGYLIAQGEVVVVNDKFGIRLTDVITPSERIRKLKR